MRRETPTSTAAPNVSIAITINMSFPIDTKTRSMDIDNEKGQQEPVEMPPRRRRTWAIGFAAVALIYLIFSNQSRISNAFRPCASHDVSHSLSEQTLVPLEAHIMSKCPDAQDCLKMLVLPAMMQVVDKVNFTLSFIGTPTTNDGVNCMHGPEECMGDIIELCASHLYPDPKIYLGFTMCLTRDYQDIPQRSLVEDCALEHGIEFEKLNECASKDDGGFGMGWCHEVMHDQIGREDLLHS
ncbi:hypothetical protein G7Y89_g6219 [Cudoniella acicularis]|uniref:Gamma interferon inducible lysosomal thiol reductase n=1 Tax=Cudoniella acicularis TaxID=354080 RepID=A0A8H4RNC2_9HELO|nr:hypothetical protein G7Y89_g6219 [Cudoniella acicularis]